ncbi:MAG: hypothetical protein E6R04_02490 [Spirochaetes bacterium]|nr:MAG: hypothetical protein E6R04_02490 [Spirochaetota bacterium]
MAEKYELPEICYDEPVAGQPANPFPFILVKQGKKLPPVLFIEERRETGEVEPGSNGESVEIVDTLMHKFVDMEVLKEKLPPHLNNIVRAALGMKPLEEASASGQAILDKVMAAVEKNRTKKGQKQ